MLDSRQLLINLELSESEVDVYLAMLKGALTAREIILVTQRSRPTVYYALSALERRGLLRKTGLPDDRGYHIESLKRLVTLLDDREKSIQETRVQLEEFVRQNQTRRQSDRTPQVSYYEGVGAVRNVLMQTIYARKQHIDALVPSENFFLQLGSHFLEQYVELRQTLGVKSRVLWGKGIEKEVKAEYSHSADARMLPSGTEDRFRTMMFLYDDTVLYISSRAGGYCLQVQSQEQIELMQIMYDALWNLSVASSN